MSDTASASSSSTHIPSTEPGKAPPPAPAGSSRLAKARVNVEYLAYGNKAAHVPASMATRSTLTTFRYALRYALRRLFRYAKYAAVGALVATLGAGLLGTLGSGLAFFAAPGIGGGIAIGVITAMIKFGWRHRGNHFRGGYWAGMKQRAQSGHDGAADEALDAASAEAKRRANNRRAREDVWMRV